MPANYDFAQLDVFTRMPLAGNPLAIFTDARGLTDKQMQALAREMNLSETTFILPREPELEVTEGTRVRIFTTREELPFAGHPTLGTALYLYSTAETAPGEIINLKLWVCPNRCVRLCFTLRRWRSQIGITRLYNMDTLLRACARV
jgi:trans-2,3-dihydro-3-hydroxyanthranilate isomerase